MCDECVGEHQYARHGGPAVDPGPSVRGTAAHQTLELNQLIPRITHMASLGPPRGIGALQPNSP